MDIPKTFNAKLISTFSSDRIYRIYSKGNDLIFIQIASGLGATPETVTAHFGLIGALVGILLKKRAKRKSEAVIQRIDQQDPEHLLAEHEHNFKLYTAEIADSSIDAPSFFASRGPQAGRWRFTLRDGRKMRFLFQGKDDMKVAVGLLPQLLNATLRVNVEWNEKKKRYRKKKSTSTA